MAQAVSACTEVAEGEDVATVLPDAASSPRTTQVTVVVQQRVGAVAGSHHAGVVEAAEAAA